MEDKNLEKKPGFHLIDTENWPRKSHYEYFTRQIKCGYSLTAPLDVTELLRFLGRKGLRFYPSFLYLTSRAVNAAVEFRMALDERGRPGYWDVVHPVHTIFHQDDKTFSDIWTYYDPDFSAFYKNLERDLDAYKDIKGIKTKPGQPRNFFCVSCTPWLSYTGYSTGIPGGDPNLFPIIAFGKFTENRGRYTLPLTVTIAHAAADGYHVNRFFLELQEALDHPEKTVGPVK